MYIQGLSKNACYVLTNSKFFQQNETDAVMALAKNEDYCSQYWQGEELSILNLEEEVKKRKFENEEKFKCYFRSTLQDFETIYTPPNFVLPLRQKEELANVPLIKTLKREAEPFVAVAVGVIGQNFFCPKRKQRIVEEIPMFRLTAEGVAFDVLVAEDVQHLITANKTIAQKLNKRELPVVGISGNTTPTQLREFKKKITRFALANTGLAITVSVAALYGAIARATGAQNTVVGRKVKLKCLEHHGFVLSKRGEEDVALFSACS